MTKAVRPYCRVYWEAIDDPKFATVWGDDARLAWWLRLLVAADMAWPSSASLPRRISDETLAALVDSGLVDLQGDDRYRIHGLDRERAGRSRSASEAASARWTAEVPDDDPRASLSASRTHPNGTAEGDAPRMPSIAEPSRAEQSQAELPPTPAKRGLRATGTNPRAVAAREKRRITEVATAIHLRYLRGELTEAEEREERRKAGLKA